MAQRSFLFQICLLIGIAVAAFSYFETARLNTIYQEDSQQFKAAMKLKPGDSQARETLADLLQRDPNSHVLNWQYGLALGAAGKPAEAVPYYRKALDLNPFYVQNGLFLYQNGVFLYQSGDPARAKIYVDAAVKLELPAEVKAEAARLTELLNKGGR